MHTRRSQDTRGPDVAIVGGGASGTLVAIQLLRRAADSGLPLHIWLIDQHGRHGLGQAYGTEHDEHLLNAMAGRMSAVPGEPEHLTGWARAAMADQGPVSGTTFLPRRRYGQYLRETLAAAERAALPGGRLTRISAAVTAIRPHPGGPGARLQVGGDRLDADVVVLATGHAPAALLCAAPDSDTVITDPWRPGALDWVRSARNAASVVIVGTGLTMVDLAVSITRARPGSVVHAVSRHGLLPRTHQGDTPALPGPLWLPAVSRPDCPVRLTELMWQVRQAVSGGSGCWRAVLEALRPHVPDLWHRMPDADKRAFLHHVARYWEVHRHLMPPATAARITTLRLTGQLVVHRGRVLEARRHGHSMRVLAGHDGSTFELDADWLINGSGGTADVTAAPSPLLRSLFAAGLARPDSVRLGIDADRSGAALSADGQPSSFLFALGPLLRGLWYETTAIPEIRDQAAALAGQIISSDQASRHPGSAA